MKKERSKVRKARFICMPKLYCMTIMCFVVLLAGTAFGVYLAYDAYLEGRSSYEGMIGGSIFFCSISLVIFCTIFINRYAMVSVVEIYEDRIDLCALLTRRSYYFCDINHIGVDYWLMQGEPEFWIYFSKEPVPMKYYHKINTHLNTKTFCRILYIPKNYNLLIQNTPPEISRQIRKCYSTVLAYKADR